MSKLFSKFPRLLHIYLSLVFFSIMFWRCGVGNKKNLNGKNFANEAFGNIPFKNEIKKQIIKDSIEDTVEGREIQWIKNDITKPEGGDIITNIKKKLKENNLKLNNANAVECIKKTILSQLKKYASKNKKKKRKQTKNHRKKKKQNGNLKSLKDSKSQNTNCTSRMFKRYVKFYIAAYNIKIQNNELNQKINDYYEDNEIGKIQDRSYDTLIKNIEIGHNEEKENDKSNKINKAIKMALKVLKLKLYPEEIEEKDTCLENEIYDDKVYEILPFPTIGVEYWGEFFDSVNEFNNYFINYVNSIIPSVKVNPHLSDRIFYFPNPYTCTIENKFASIGEIVKNAKNIKIDQIFQKTSGLNYFKFYNFSSNVYSPNPSQSSKSQSVTDKWTKFFSYITELQEDCIQNALHCVNNKIAEEEYLFFISGINGRMLKLAKGVKKQYKKVYKDSFNTNNPKSQGTSKNIIIPLIKYIEVMEEYTDILDHILEHQEYILKQHGGPNQISKYISLNNSVKRSFGKLFLMLAEKFYITYLSINYSVQRKVQIKFRDKLMSIINNSYLIDGLSELNIKQLTQKNELIPELFFNNERVCEALLKLGIIFCLDIDQFLPRNLKINKNQLLGFLNREIIQKIINSKLDCRKHKTIRESKFQVKYIKTYQKLINILSTKNPYIKKNFEFLYELLETVIKLYSTVSNLKNIHVNAKIAVSNGIITVKHNKEKFNTKDMKEKPKRKHHFTYPMHPMQNIDTSNKVRFYAGPIKAKRFVPEAISKSAAKKMNNRNPNNNANQIEEKEQNNNINFNPIILKSIINGYVNWGNDNLKYFKSANDVLKKDSIKNLKSLLQLGFVETIQSGRSGAGSHHDYIEFITKNGNTYKASIIAPHKGNNHKTVYLNNLMNIKKELERICEEEFNNG
ncbi:MAG: hypothetical protein GY830_10960 [Bacteroidetes bacterium]|nr:hypothetical protein [Bacteroidota bacterium]